MSRPARVLPVIIASQLAGTSLWFAGNAVLPDLQLRLDLGDGSLAWMTSAVQLGFIAGTLASALLALADRVSPRLFFLLSCLLGAAFNLGLLWADDAASLFLARFLTGLCLAGIYPVGMKIAAGWYREGLGRAIGWLVGALVLGTALPHLLRALASAGGASKVGSSLPWQWGVVGVSLLAATGGVLMAVSVPDGPHLPRGGRFSNPGKSATAVREIFSSKPFRAAAFGYFGHMWELYTFWAFVPALLALHALGAGAVAVPTASVSLRAFWVIAAGSLGCVVGGILARRFGSARIAAAQMAASGLCCLVLPWAISWPPGAFFAYLLFWGVVVVGDSPQLSTLNARTAPPHRVGSALTVATCIGFALTIGSIQLVAVLVPDLGLQRALALLVVGPLLGLWGLRPLLREKAS